MTKHLGMIVKVNEKVDGRWQVEILMKEKSSPGKDKETFKNIKGWFSNEVIKDIADLKDRVIECSFDNKGSLIEYWILARN